MSGRKGLKNSFAGPLFKNNEGYTLLEMLIALSIYLFIATFLVKAMPLLKHYLFSDHDRQMEWEVFLNLAGPPDGLTRLEGYLLNDGRTIQYEQYGTMIRRRVNGEGHEPLLLNVKDVAFIVDGKWLEIRAQFSTGKTFNERILLPSHLRKE